MRIASFAGSRFPRPPDVMVSPYGISWHLTASGLSPNANCVNHLSGTLCTLSLAKHIPALTRLALASVAHRITEPDRTISLYRFFGIVQITSVGVLPLSTWTSYLRLGQRLTGRNPNFWLGPFEAARSPLPLAL